MSWETNEGIVRACDAAYNRGQKDMLEALTKAPESVLPETQRLRLVAWLNHVKRLNHNKN